MKKIISILFCISSLFLTNSCMASQFGDTIALICATTTSSLKLKMTSSQLEEWEKGGITGQASDVKGTYYFQQQSPDSGMCYLIARSNGIYVKIYRERDKRDILNFEA